MTAFLLDTNVVSETMRRQPSDTVRRWLEEKAGQTFLSTIVIAEVALGVQLMPDGRRRRNLEAWFDKLVHVEFAQRILPFDTEAALVFGSLVARARRLGHPTPVADAQIAAVASVHGLAVATRDIADFDGFGIALVNPFKAD